MTILLTILKVIGIILLVILGILLAIVLLVLFVPVRYRAEGAYQGEFWTKGRITWLFHLLSIRFSFDGAFAYSVKIAGLQFLPKRKKKKSEKAAAAAEENSGQADEETAVGGGEKQDVISDDMRDQTGQEAVDDSGNPAEAAAGENISAADVNGQDSADADGVRSAGAEDGGCDEDISEQTSASNDIFAFLEKLLEKVYAIFRKCGEKYEAICVKIEKIKKKVSYYIRILRREETKELLRLVFCQLQGILRHVLPRRLDVRFYVGTGDPASTGQILALQGLLYPVLRENVCIVPDFEEKRFEGTFYMKGRITAFVLLLCALHVIINKNFRKLIRILRKKEEA